MTANNDTAHAPALPGEPVRTDAEPLPADRYLNREISWLEFNARVLALAEDRSAPLLERAKFLAIHASNLDEFYMVRVAGLMRRAKTGLSVRSADGLSPREQIDRIRRGAQDRADRHSAVWTEQIRPGLAEAGVHLLEWSALSGEERRTLTEYFHAQIYPVLTPLAVDPAHPFPYISGLSLNLAVTVRDPRRGGEHFARVKVPPNVPRLVRVERETEAPESGEDHPAGADAVVWLLPVEELIAAHLPVLFQGMEVVGHHLFRVTRNADFTVEEDRDEDLLQALERELERRRFGSPVRLEVTADISAHMLDLLLRELDVDAADVVRVPGLLDLTGLWQIHGLDRPELKDPSYVPATPPQFGERETPKNIFAALREGDILVHHPYDAFSTTVQRFIEQAAADEDVLAIKQTLYRTSGDSPIVDALIEAANAGKQVVALVEIKARFDEQANISWARKLEQAGVHVAYGMLGLKTHCKTCLVVRREGSALRRYCHIGTGNYNPGTARLYEDLGLFTADPRIGADLTDLFNSLTGFSHVSDYRNLLVAPHGLRPGVLARIDQEIAAHRAGRPAGITMKANALVDEQVIDALYRASQAGVPVKILVRGICGLRPGVPGLSENIRVRSILGRFLEHSRILHFSGADEHWIGSADMMHRNLDRRVEVFAQVHDPALRRMLTDTLELAFDPAVRCWELGPDGRWTALPETGSRDGDGDGEVRDYHQLLLRLHGGRHDHD